MDKLKRKALKLAYKMALPPMGIFCIRNVESGRMLLDRSANLTGSLNRHRIDLQRGTHRNVALMTDWRRVGAAGFAFEVLEQLPERTEPDFNYDHELECRLDVWRRKVPLGSADSYR